MVIKCRGRNCPLRKSCQRHIHLESGGRGVTANFDKTLMDDRTTNCEHYWRV